MSAGADRNSHHHHHHGPGAHHHSAPVFWPKEATLLLIELFKQNEGRFSSGLVRKKLIWKEIAEHVQRSGHAFTWEQCEGRWKTLTAAYRRALLHNRCSQFHKELHEVLGYGPTNCHDQLQPQPRPIAPKPPSQQPQQQQQQHPPPPTAPSASNPANALGLTGTPTNGSCVQGSLGLSADAEAGVNPSSRMSGKSIMQPRFKKRRTPNSDNLDWMAEFEDRQERRSREFLEKMERMHCEKISVITELIGVMKELIK